MGGISNLRNHKELVWNLIHNNFNVDVVGRLLDKAHQNRQKNLSNALNVEHSMKYEKVRYCWVKAYYTIH